MKNKYNPRKHQSSTETDGETIITVDNTKISRKICHPDTNGGSWSIVYSVIQ